MKMILLPLLSSVLFSLSFPDPSLFFLSFLFLVPLLHHLDRHGNTFRKSFFTGLLWTFFSALGTAHFIIHALIAHYNKNIVTALLFFIGAIVIPYGLLYGTFCASYHILRGKSSPLKILIPPALWITIEYLSEALPFTVPWSTIGHTLVPWNNYVQIADVTGPYGLSFLVILINSLIYHLIRKSASPHHGILQRVAETVSDNKLTVTILATLVCIPPIYGSVRISQYHKSLNRNNKTVKIIQGNFSQRERWTGNFSRRIAAYVKKTNAETNKTAGPDLIIWPETVLNNTQKLKTDFFRTLIRVLPAGSTLISGGVRSSGRKNQFNTAYIINAKKVTWYDKKILLPFAETGNTYPLLEQYYHAPSSFTPGFGKRTYSFDKTRVGISICFESIYARHIRKSVKEGARLLVNLSNDAWFGRRNMPKLHLNIARLRAIENRRYMLRASNSGISAIIDCTGKIISRTPLFKRSAVGGSFSSLNARTVYTSLGDWPVLMALVILAFATGKVYFIQDNKEKRHSQ